MNQFDEFTLNEYLDGTLDAVSRQQVEQWLAESEEAQAMLADLQLAFSALGSLADAPLANDLSAAIVAQIEGEETAVMPAWVRWLAAIQLVAAIGMSFVLWPKWQPWLSAGRTALSTAFSQITMPQFDIGAQVMVWITAVSQQIQFTPPTIDLATNQWGLLLALAFLAWLAGNRLLFTEESS
ncbi:MAG: hypothetical protein DWQ04_20660 [Chloroflexi bacterium]|nr:MAG: hypothetical protein DWQ04_20660 [Chloroflexota bacterium]